MPFQPSLSEVLLFDPARPGWLYFHHPEQVIVTDRLEDVAPALGEVEKQVEQRGRYAAGFLSYEAAPAFDTAFRVKNKDKHTVPLLWFGVYAQPTLLPPNAIHSGEDLPLGPWTADTGEREYTGAIERIKNYIACGETYQVNYTYRLHTPCSAPAWQIFSTLVRSDIPPYAAFLETEAWAIGSLSPELFFTLEGEILTSRPMKGTAPRGVTLEDDRGLADWLYHSEKNRAENVMIVDMVRNDLGRIARVGSVRVPELFKIETYPTVLQMTSTVQAETGASLYEIFGALFPGASITGAPKVRTMQIIAELEATPRQVYTGAIGFFSPGRKAQFNIAIRTMLVDKVRQEAEYGVGGGIVWDSEAEMEWEETKTKARVLYERPHPFQLLETMRWSPEEGWFLLEKHLERLERSASYFSYPFDPETIYKELDHLEASFRGLPQMVRLKLDRHGQISLEPRPIPEKANPTRVGIARSPIHSSDRFLYHKTTRRSVYERAQAEMPGFDDVLLWNERGELTESCIANLVVELDGELFTPPLQSGLLPGTYRAWLLEGKKVQERVIRVGELKQCSRIFLANSVRGMWEVKVEG